MIKIKEPPDQTSSFLLLVPILVLDFTPIPEKSNRFLAELKIMKPWVVGLIRKWLFLFILVFLL